MRRIKQQAAAYAGMEPPSTQASWDGTYPATEPASPPASGTGPTGRILDANGNPTWRSPFDSDDYELDETDDDAPLPPSPKHSDASPDKESPNQPN